MYTIIDVAKAAGVSPSTASKALNNSADISEEKRQRVFEAVKELGYTPIRVSAAKKKMKKTIFVLECSSFQSMHEGVEEAARDLNIPTVAINISPQIKPTAYEQVLNVLKMLPPDSVYGLILLHNNCSNKKLWEEFCKYPVVQVGEAKPSTPMINIAIDDYAASYDMTNYLINKGYKKIVYASTGDTQKAFNYSKARLKGFRDAMEDAGLQFSEGDLFKVDYSIDGGIDLAKEIMEKHLHKIDAVICNSDYTAIGCVNTFINNGVKVPGDIAVCGFDNISLSEAMSPALTTVAQPYREMGMAAVKALVEQVTSPSDVNKKIILEHSIIEGETA